MNGFSECFFKPLVELENRALDLKVRSFRDTIPAMEMAIWIMADDSVESLS